MTTINQVFYTTKQALQVQLSENGIFFEVAPSLNGKDKAYDWKKKTGVKFSVSELCNLANALESFRVFGESEYIKCSQTICGQAYKNMQFVHINRKGHQVRTGLNLYNGGLSFIIVNTKLSVNIAFPILATERIRLERFLYRIVDIALSEPSKYERLNDDTDVKDETDNIQLPKDNILEFTDKQNKKVLDRFKVSLSGCQSHDEIENLREKFLDYCKTNKFDFSYIEIESLFLGYQNDLEEKFM